MDACAVDRLQFDAISFRELAERADRPKLLFDRAVERRGDGRRRDVESAGRHSI
jgi:hypothetical protein